MASRTRTLAFIAAATAALCAPAHAQELTDHVIKRSPLRAPECRDPPPLDPITHFESLPTHDGIASYLMDDRSAARFSCTSATLTYVGTRDENGIRVVSKYRAGGGPHAETYARRDDRRSGWPKHGVVRIQRRDGTVQAIEYYCRGFEIGFHRYFDAAGKLVAIADYTHSDYEWEKRIPSPPYRAFYSGSSQLGSVPAGLASSHRFREVYRVRDDRAERVSLSLADTFSSNWQTVDPTSTIRDWTEPGMQGSVQLYGQPWQIRNFDFEYQDFAAVYHRKRLGTPGARVPTEFNSTLLECPWIDDAMAPGLDDPHFKVAPATLTDAERAASPEHKLESCLRAPSARCLMEQALVAARRARPLTGNQMRNYADDALAAGQPALARTAMEEVLADTRGYTFPNPFFARQGAIKAQAESAMGLRDEATKSADAAFTNAMGKNTHAAGRDVGALEAIGPRLARAGAIDKAHAAFREVPVAYAEDAPLTLEEIAIAQARQGDVSGARETLAELTQLGAQAGAPMPRQTKWQTIVSRAADRVNGEIAAAQARAGATAESVASLRRIEVTPWYVWYLGQVTAVAEERGDKALQAAVASLWITLFDEAQRTIESARDVEERRRLYHTYLAALRMRNAPGTDVQRGHALESLRRNLDLFTNVGQRVRAGCELAFTYQQLGESVAAATQFANALNLQPPPAMPREAGTAPLPAGACSYWMTSTPMSVPARNEIERIFEARRSWVQSNNGMTRPEQGLQELALILSESEAGEIDWQTGARLTR